MTEWPALPYDQWNDTLDTLHMELQILGKVRLALSPWEPEWAHVPLYVTARGISTGPVAAPDGLVEVEADLDDHQVVVRASSGDVRVVPLTARPVAEFYADVVETLQGLGIDAALSTMPQEVPDPIPFPDDTVHRAYDPDSARRFWRILTLVHQPFDDYRAAFRGRVTRVQLFWGSMDLNVARFSGRPASAPPGADLLARVAHDAEQVSAGFWPGDARFSEPAFYAYAYPAPAGVEHLQLPSGPSFWSDDLGELVLRYEDVRKAASPAEMIREFLDGAYGELTRGTGWDPALVRRPA